MECRRCASCDQIYRPRAQVPHQRYCALAACQRERRRRWQQSKLRTDAEYRAKHPEYTDRNRLEQRRRDRRIRAALLAKMDASTPIHPVPSGTYRLLPGVGGDLAKKDAWTVKITLISKDYEPDGEAAAILQREDVIGAAGSPC